MAEKFDGGPAFPQSPRVDGWGKEHPAEPGMSLRDYFAAMAMQAEMITTFSDATPEAAERFVEGAMKAGHSVERHLAFNAYKLADAMLAERAK